MWRWTVQRHRKVLLSRANTANSDSRNEVRVYESPDVLQLNKESRTATTLRTKTIPKRRTTRPRCLQRRVPGLPANHEQWYKDRRQMQEDMGTYVDQVRLRQGCNQVTYPSEGWVASALPGVYQANQNSLA